MTAVSEYPQLKAHDPDGTRPRTVKCVLDTGDALLSATTLFPVDDTGQPLSGSDFTVEVISIGFISAGLGGDIWGVNYRLHGGRGMLGASPLPMICLRPFLASQPDEPAYDQTFRVPIKQT